VTEKVEGPAGLERDVVDAFPVPTLRREARPDGGPDLKNTTAQEIS